MSRRCSRAFRRTIAITWSRTERSPSPASSAARTTCSLRPMSERSLVDRAPRIGRVERERGDFDIEMLAFLRHHPVAAGHETRRRRKRNSAGVFEGFTRLEDRLFSDDARTLDLLQASLRVGNAPMAGLELDRLRAEIGYVDRVGPEKISVAGRRPLRNESGRHGHFDLAGHGAIHRLVVQFSSSGLAIRGPSGIMAESVQERKAEHGTGFDRTRSPA